MSGRYRYTAANDQTKINMADVKLSEAFCEGRAAQIAGAGSNPYPSGSEQYTAWADGQSTTTPQGFQDSCAQCIPILAPNLIGLTSAAAQTAITTAGLAVGKITGSTGVVTVQAPVANTKCQRNDVVTFTIA